MSKFRVEQHKVIGHGQRGTIRWEIVANEKALALFSATERNAILREGMRSAGVHWLNVFFPKRFTDYAKQLGYYVSAKYRKRKRAMYGGAEPRPLIYTGDMMRVSFAGANVTAVSKGTTQTAAIKIPCGHPIATVVTRVLKTIPAVEVQSMAWTLGKTVRDLINNANVSDAQRTRLTAVQRHAVGIKPRASYGSKTNRKRGAV